MVLGKSIITKGSIYIFLYVIASAVSNVFVNHTTRSIAPIVSLFYTSLFTILFFSMLNFKEVTKNIALIKANKKAILWLNLLNAIIWFVIFFSLKFLSPAVFSCLFLGAIPLNLFMLELRTSKATKKSNFLTGTLLVLMFVLMIVLVAQDINDTNFTQVVTYGLIVTILGGIIAAFIMKFSKQLATNQLSASLVVSLRFYGLLLISLILILFTSDEFVVQPAVLLEFLILALVSMALPLFLLQKALTYLSPLYASIIITSIPVITYGIQLCTGYYLFSQQKMVVIILFSLTLILLNYVKKRNI